jgi:hypothetical protein
MVDKNDHYAIKVAQNLTYVNQLRTQVSCGGLSFRDAAHKMKYRAEYLVKYFLQFNECSGVESTHYIPDKRKKRQAFHLRVTPGVDFSTSKVESVFSTTEKEYPDREVGFRMGAEAEFVLPFNKNKWVIWIEPTYQTYKTTHWFAASFFSEARSKTLP